VETGGQSKPFYRKARYIILIGILVALLLFSFLSGSIVPPKSSDQSRLDRTIYYFAQAYDPTTGLVAQAHGSSVFWLYPDNYLASLAIGRYAPANSSTSSFAMALSAAVGGYLATLPQQYNASEFTALNSTAASFNCPSKYTLSWTPQVNASASAKAEISTQSNTGSQTCASGNYADLLLLQAIWFHRFGDSSKASSFYSLASADFNGKGFSDAVYNGTYYRTSNLALYVYASSCLGENSSTYTSAERLLFSLQDNSTGGFYQGYTVNLSALNAPESTPVGGVTTEATALASLVLDQLVHPISGC
jgi:hypothetical protein